MTYKEARCEFTALIAELINYMNAHGVRAALAEGMDRRTVKDPTTDHMQGSLHEIGLAQDIDLYTPEGIYLDKTTDHEQFGFFWEALLPPYTHWGGRFSDGNHYSFSSPEIPGCLTSTGVLRK